MGRKSKNKKSNSSGQGASSQDGPKPLSKQAKKDVDDLIKAVLESKFLRTLAKSAYRKTDFLISQSKHMLWVLKRTISMRRFF